MTKRILRLFDQVVHNKKISLAVIIVVTVLAYGNIFPNDFVMDDHLFIADWPLIENMANIAQFFGPDNQPIGEEGVYSPLKTLFHSINYHLWGRMPAGYHLISLIVHLLGVYFVYKISRLLSKDNLTSFICALLFSLHPVHAEAITFMTASIDTLGVVFLFISFYFYIRYWKEPLRRFSPLYVAALVFGVLAIFTHELCIVLPLFFLVYHLYFHDSRRSSQYILFTVSPFFIIAMTYVALKFIILKDLARGGYLMQSGYLTMLVVIKSFAKYLLVLLFPFTLSVKPQISPGIFAVDMEDFDRAAVLSQSIADLQVLWSLLLIVAVVYVAVIVWKKHPLVSFCITWFFVSLIPVSNIIPSGCFYAERYLYPGSFGFCLLAAYAIAYFLDSKNAKKVRAISLAALVVITGFYFVRTVLRNADWRSDLTFCQNEVKVNPESAMLQNRMGILYLSAGHPEKAVGHLERSVEVDPQNAQYCLTLAENYMQLGLLGRTKETIYRAFTIDPDFPEAYYNLAVVLATEGRHKEAWEQLNRSLLIFQRQGRAQEAERFQKAFYDYFRKVR